MTFHPYITEYTEYQAPDGLIYKFDGNDRFLISEDGLGMPPINYIVHHGPFQHGESVLDFRLAPRTIQVVHRRDAGTRIGYWDARTELINALRPNRQLANSFTSGILRKRLPFGRIREVKVTSTQGPGFVAHDVSKWDEYAFIETLRFTANDPTMYDPTVHTVNWSLSANTNLIFPFTFPFTFANSIITGSQSITYVGQWMTYPTIVITGPVYGPRIKNVTLDTEIALNYEVALGEVITITLAYDNKTVTNQNGVDLLGVVADTYGLANFRIAPDPEASGGVNVIEAGGYNAAVGSTAYSLSYLDRYVGI
jgi:hypothetical protein